MDIPVTPPSIKCEGIKNPLIPMPTEMAPAIMNKASFNPFNKTGFGKNFLCTNKGIIFVVVFFLSILIQLTQASKN